jgi:hypothetical protein
MRVGHDAFAFDDKPGATHAPHRIKTPWRVKNRLLAEREDLNYRPFRIGGMAHIQPGGRQQKRRSLF